jgi:hypothetical protein
MTDNTSNNPAPQAPASPRTGVGAVRSCPLDLQLYADDSQVLRAAQALTDEIEANQYRKLKYTVHGAVRRFVTCLLCNAFDAWTIDPTCLLAIRLGCHDYDDVPDFNGWAVRLAVQGLEALGYLRKVGGGYWDHIRECGVVTRFAATDSLIAVFKDWGLSVVLVTERTPLIEIRPSGKARKAAKRQGKKLPDRLPWPATDRLAKDKRQRNLRTINDALSRQFQGLEVSNDDLRRALGKKKRHVNLRRQALHRVFTTDPHHNGRFVGPWWQAITKRMRHYIRIAKPGALPEKTVELDFDSMHPAMLYATKKSRINRDLYAVYSDARLNKQLRPATKQMLLSLINAETRSEAKKSFVKHFNTRIYQEYLRDEWDDEEKDPPRYRQIDKLFAEVFPDAPPWQQVFQDVIDHHAPIAEYFGNKTSAGRWLMFEDAEIAEMVMQTVFRQHGVMPLVNHDSFIVPESIAESVRETMITMFAARFGGVVPGISAKTPKQSLSEAPPQPPTESCRYTRLLRHWSQTQTNKAVPVTA